MDVWNALPSVLLDITDFQKFKQMLKAYMMSNNNPYSIYKP